MEALSLEYNKQTNKKLLLLILLLEFIFVSVLFSFNYKYALVLLGTTIFLVLNFTDVKITLWFLIAFSILVAYSRGDVTAAMMIALGSAYVFVCLSFFFGLCVGKTQVTKTRLNLPVAVFLVMAFLQIIRGLLISLPIKWLLIESLAYAGFGIVFLVTSLCHNKQMIKRFFQLLIFVAYYQAIVGLWNFFLVGHRIGGYLFGAFPSLVALVLLNLSFHSEKRSKKIGYAVLSLPLLLHLMFSFTRGFWFVFLAGFLFSYSLYVNGLECSLRRKVWRLLKGTLAFILIVVVLSVGIQRLFLPGKGLERFSARFLSSFSSKLSSSTFSNVTRLLEYGVAFEKIKSKPIFGYGVGYKLSYVDPILREKILSGIVHQFYIMIILKMGLVGLFAFLWIYYIFFKEGLRGSRLIKDNYYKGLAYGFMANSVEQLVISFTNHQFATVDNNFYLAFTLAGVMVLISMGTRGQRHGHINHHSELESQRSAE
jgi:O-antigen ligase